MLTDTRVLQYHGCHSKSGRTGRRFQSQRFLLAEAGGFARSFDRASGRLTGRTPDTLRYTRFLPPVAEGERFELSIPCGMHAFQACALDHYANPPPRAGSRQLYKGLERDKRACQDTEFIPVVEHPRDRSGRPLQVLSVYTKKSAPSMFSGLN